MVVNGHCLVVNGRGLEGNHQSLVRSSCGFVVNGYIMVNSFFETFIQCDNQPSEVLKMCGFSPRFHYSPHLS